jgi:carotenoid cleavage dioxygenase-like enzyme
MGNFTFIAKENEAYEIPDSDLKFGKVPTDISGVYLRNGPN